MVLFLLPHFLAFSVQSAFRVAQEAMRRMRKMMSNDNVAEEVWRVLAEAFFGPFPHKAVIESSGFCHTGQK